MPSLGIRLQLKIGATLPVPAPYPVMAALGEVEVQSNDRECDGFQLRFKLGRDSARDYGLLRNGDLNPMARVIISVLINSVPEVLIDGVITRQDFTPSNRPGESALVVTGVDIGQMLDLKEKSAPYENQGDSTIVSRLLGLPQYSAYGLMPKVTPTTDIPTVSVRLPSQHGTDLQCIQALAARNGFVFYIEPTAPGMNLAYWGAENRLGQHQPPLTMNMGGDTNVDLPLNFTCDALGPIEPEVTIYDRDRKQAVLVAPPPSNRPPLALRPIEARRKMIMRDVASLSQTEALLRASSASSAAANAVTVTGEIDAVRYGRVLRSRRLVSVRGVGSTYGGSYYVRQVTHRLRNGSYKQTFNLTREGLGALAPFVMA